MPANESLDKFECRACGCRQSIVRNTEVLERQYKGRKMVLIKRRRVCRHCRLSSVTVEHQYEEINHTIAKDSAVRPWYDMGRAVGTLETINGLLKASEELSALPPRKAPIPTNPSDVARGLSEHLGKPSSSSPTEKPARRLPKKRKRSK